MTQYRKISIGALTKILLDRGVGIHLEHYDKNKKFIRISTYGIRKPAQECQIHYDGGIEVLDDKKNSKNHPVCLHYDVETNTIVSASSGWIDVIKEKVDKNVIKETNQTEKKVIQVAERSVDTTTSQGDSFGYYG